MRQTAAIWLTTVLCLGCSTQPAALPTLNPQPVMVPGEPALADPPPARVTLDAGATITGLGAGEALVVGTSSGAWEVRSNALVALSVYSQPGEPAETGAIRAVATAEGSALVLSETGIFAAQQSWLVASPLGTTLASSTVYDLCVDGAGLTWVTTSDGVYRAGTSLLHVAVGEHPRTLGAAHSRVLIGDGASVHVLSPDTWTVQSSDLGTAVNDIDGRWVATDGGLWELSSESEWRLYPLSDGVPAAVQAVAAYDDHAVVVADRRVISTDPLVTLATLDGPAAGIAVQSGDIWVAVGSELVGLLVGEVPSFKADVLPILEAACNGCHGDGVGGPKHDLADYETVVSLADQVIARVTTGQMPPAGTPALTEDQLETLVRWYGAGLAR